MGPANFLKTCLPLLMLLMSAAVLASPAKLGHSTEDLKVTKPDAQTVVTEPSVTGGAEKPVTDAKIEWVDFSDHPSRHLRGYANHSFPPPRWSFENGCFKLESTEFGSDLMTRATYENFELEFDWKFVSGGNSGIIFAVQPGHQYSYLSGPEIQLLDDARHPDGKTALTSLGALYGLAEADPEAKKKLVLNEINKCRLIVQDNRLKFYVNDVLLTDVSLDPKDLNPKIEASKFKKMKDFYKQRKGHIVFQDHGGKAEFCNLRIRQL